MTAAEKARLREEAKTKGLSAAFTAAHTAAAESAARSQAWQDYRAGERNAEAIAAEYQMRQYRAGEREEYVVMPPICTVENVEQPKSWWQRGWDAVTHPVQTFENAMIAWGRRSERGRKVIRFLSDQVASLNDPVLNPVTAAFAQSIQDGWAGLTYGVSSTLHLAGETFRSIGKGDWEKAKRYGGAWLEGTIKGWLWGGVQTTAQLVWGAIKMATPIGLFETVPTWWSAVKEARLGKRGGWDVALTSLFLMANVLGIAGAANGVQTQATRTALIREYGEPVRPLLAEQEVIPLLRSGELAPKPWTEYVPLEYQKDVIPAFEGQSAIAIKLNDMATVYRYWGGKSPEHGPWVTVYRNLSPSEARSLLALPSKNTATNITEFGIPQDVIVLVGKAANQVSESWAGPYAVGGGIQIYIPDPSVLLRFP